MKYKGKKIEGRNKEIIAIPRPNGNIVFIAEALESWDLFDKICTEPEPPEVLKPGGIKEKDLEDSKYLKAINEHNVLRTHWIVLMSLKSTEDLEWETVNYNDPSTWMNYEKELKDAGFNPLEIGRIVRGVMSANGLNDDMIEAAKKDFLAGQGVVKDK